MLVTARHKYVAAGAPLDLRGVLQAGCHQHELVRGPPFSVRERPDQARAPADHAIDPLNGVVGADPPPVGAWEARVRKGLGVILARLDFGAFASTLR